MNKQTTVLLLIGAIIVVLFSTTASSNTLKAQSKQTNRKGPRKSMIGRIKNSRVGDGCGCYFSPTSEAKWRWPRYLFIADTFEKNAWMNIDGVDTKLQLMRSTRPRTERVGSRLTRTYIGPVIRLSVVYITTRMCKPDDDNCESTDYTATFRLTKDRRTQTMKLKGGCGC